jgi:hypothetical protein
LKRTLAKGNQFIVDEVEEKEHFQLLSMPSHMTAPAALPCLALPCPVPTSPTKQQVNTIIPFSFVCYHNIINNDILCYE